MKSRTFSRSRTWLDRPTTGKVSLVLGAASCVSIAATFALGLSLDILLCSGDTDCCDGGEVISVLMAAHLIAALVVARLGWSKIVTRVALRAQLGWVGLSVGLYVVVWYALSIAASLLARVVSPVG